MPNNLDKKLRSIAGVCSNMYSVGTDMLSDILNHFRRPQECLELEKHDLTSICKIHLIRLIYFSIECVAFSVICGKINYMQF